jgi:hypothetical protein
MVHELEKVKNLDRSLGNAHDDEDSQEGADHQEDRSLQLSLLQEETDDTPRENPEAPNRKGRQKDQSHVSEGQHFFEERLLIHIHQDSIHFFLEPPDRKEAFARMLQDDSINRNLNIIISQGQRKVEKDGHLIEDGKEDGKGTPQDEMDQGEEENRIPVARHQVHGAPIRILEKQLSGEMPR